MAITSFTSLRSLPNNTLRKIGRQTRISARGPAPSAEGGRDYHGPYRGLTLDGLMVLFRYLTAGRDEPLRLLRPPQEASARGRRGASVGQSTLSLIHISEPTRPY